MKRTRKNIPILGLCGALMLHTTAPAAGVLDSGLYTSPNGETFTYVKEGAEGRDVLRFRSRDGRELSEQELHLYEEKNPAPVLDEDTLKKVRDARPGEMFDVIIWLSRSPAGAIARLARLRREPLFQLLSERAQKIRRAARPPRSLPPEEEKRFAQEAKDKPDFFSAQDKEELRRIAEEVESLTQAMRKEVAEAVERAAARDRAEFERRLSALGGRVRGRVVTQGAFEATLPAGNIPRLAQDPLVGRIILEPKGEPELDNQRTSLGLTTGFWSDGVDGGIWDAGVLDTGVQQDHPALSHLSFLSDAGTTDGDGHGTAVAGIIASDDATFRGMAFGMQTMLVGSASMSDADWMVSSAADDPEAVNLSFGFGRANDVDYSPFDQFWDGLIDDHSLLVGKSAGNAGDGTTTITHPAPAYNLLAVANVYDEDTVTRGDDVIWGSSSRGPTLNGRKKPDISAPGQFTTSANNDWAGAGADFIQFGGTSAAAPHVTGATILLTDLRASDNPAANKAVLINTADAWDDNGTSGDDSDDGSVPGSLWNKTYGWGYLDLWEAWFNGTDVFTGLVDDGITPAGPDFRLYRGQMFANEKATLAWNRHVGYNGANNPTQVEALTDLDLYAYNASNGALISSSLSGANNVEQVAVAASGQTVLKVDVFGAVDADVGVESFALSTEENFDAATPPFFTLAGPTMTFQRCGPSIALSRTVHNNGEVASFNNNVTLSLPAGMALVSGANPQNVGTIPAGGSAVATWTVRTTSCPFLGLKVVTYTNNSSSYGESFSGAGVQTLLLLP